jgi:hypothetical protein
MAEIEPTSEWVDGSVATNDPPRRRVVRVFEVGDRYVHGVGWWQQQVDGRWQNTPQTTRKTRILRSAFERQYSPLEGS